MPGIVVDQVAPGARRMLLDATWPKKDSHALGPQQLDAAPEWDTAGERRVDERKDHGRHAQAGGLCEYAQGIGVADALRPLVDGVVGGRRDDNGVWY